MPYCSEGKWVLTEIATLPGEDPMILRRSNCDTLSSKRRSNVSVMGQGVSDEAIVDVKPVAGEDTVTYLRIKLPASDRKSESKGGTH